MYELRNRGTLNAWSPVFTVLLLVVLNCPAADVHAAAPLVRIALDDAGALMLRLGDDELLDASPPKLYFFDWVDNGEPTRPDFSWMTKAKSAYDPQTTTLTTSHNWGRFSVTWAPGEDRVDFSVAVLNDTDKQIAEMHLWLTAGFQFPETPKGYRWSKRWAVMGGADRTGAVRPAAAVADCGRASIVACLLANDRIRRSALEEETNRGWSWIFSTSHQVARVQFAPRSGLARAAMWAPTRSTWRGMSTRTSQGGTPLRSTGPTAGPLPQFIRPLRISVREPWEKPPIHAVGVWERPKSLST